MPYADYDSPFPKYSQFTYHLLHLNPLPFLVFLIRKQTSILKNKK